MINAHAAEVTRRAAVVRLPSIGWQASVADAGGLIAYGSNLRECIATRPHTSPAFSPGRSRASCRSSSRELSNS